MKTLLIFLAAYYISVINARLIEKNTEKPADTEPTESPVPVRITRQVYYEDGIGISREDKTEEDDRPYVRKGRYSVKSKSTNTAATKDKSKSAATMKIFKENGEIETKTEKVLIKKPIPKFNEVEYEDFQGKINKLPVKLADSGEHEDEDFNLDDYEFDVNHDEFVGRGKPLEPRVKIKAAKAGKSKTNLKRKTTVPPPEIKIQSKVVIPTEQQVSAKKSVITKKAADKMKEDYYDDVVTTTKVPEKDAKRDLDEEFSDDSEDSKEVNSKSLSRVARSPWFVKLLSDKMGEKTATVMSKIINTMPLLHKGYMQYYEDTGISVRVLSDPFRGKDYLF